MMLHRLIPNPLFLQMSKLRPREGIGFFKDQIVSKFHAVFKTPLNHDAEGKIKL